MNKRYNTEEETSYWISFSDLMAGLLIIFILLFIYKMLDFQNETVKLQELQQELEKTKQEVIELSSTRLKIIALLQEAFEKENINIAVDANTGAIMLREGILFDTGKSEIKEEGKDFLEKFIPIYLSILLENQEIRAEVAEIIVEGHTDNVGTYLYNLNLSQDRAFNVVKFMISDDFKYHKKEVLKKYLTANGKSFSNIIEVNGLVDQDASRRVEFKFRLKEEETLFEIKERLEAGGRKNE